LFCQNAAETGVTGWLVTYFKGSGILTGTLSTYTVTVMWGATLIARLLIAFVFPFKNPRTAMVGMSGLTVIAYILLMNAHTQAAAIALLFAFAFAMAGMNPTAVACAGRMTSVTSIGILLPVGSLGAVVMPWCIGMVAQRADLQAGMMLNLVPCLGLVLFALAVRRLPQEEMA
jgi:fucose permease